jgi:hypothetical protein
LVFLFVWLLEEKVVLIFGDIVLVERIGFVLSLGDIERTSFVLRFEGLDKVLEHIYCVSCIDDSSLILLFPLHMFLVNNFSVNLFNYS